MEKQITKQNIKNTKLFGKEHNEESKIIKFKFSADRVIAESKESILVDISDNFNVDENPPSVWISKKLVFKAEYGNYITAYLRDTFDFDIMEWQSLDSECDNISAEQLKRLIALVYSD